MARPLTPETAGSLSLAEQHEWHREANRSPAVRQSPAEAGTGLAHRVPFLGTDPRGPEVAPAPTLVAAVERPAGCLVAPFARRLAFGPDPTSEVAITWQVPAPVYQPFVRVGDSPGSLGKRIDAGLSQLRTPRCDIDPANPVPASITGAVEQYYLQATVRGLRPGTRYYYAVGHRGWDGAELAGSFGSFTTAPLGREPFTFTAFGDQGVTVDAVALANLVRAQRPAFHLHAGDLAYAERGGRGLVTDSYDPRAWDGFLTQIEPVASQVPWQVAVGNHEMEAWYSPDGYGGLRRRFAFPEPGTTYYSFTYGNVGFVSLDANDVSHEIPANHGYTAGAQTAWLADRLARLRADPGVDFVVAYFHHCAYCSCVSHSSEGGVRDHWTPLFDRYSVDLVVNGHNHLYERTDPLRAGAVTKAAPAGATVTPATEGTTYITAGGAGNSLYTFPAGLPDSYETAVAAGRPVEAYVNQPGGTKEPETVEWSRVRYTGYSLVVVDSVPASLSGTSTLTVRALDELGREIDRVVLARAAHGGGAGAAARDR